MKSVVHPKVRIKVCVSNIARVHAPQAAGWGEAVPREK